MGLRLLLFNEKKTLLNVINVFYVQTIRLINISDIRNKLSVLQFEGEQKTKQMRCLFICNGNK